MPIYTYYCKVCDNDLEIISKISDRDEQRCEDCGYRLVRNLDRPGMVWSPTRNGGYSL
jgi:putative FmdB family regulatory protein